MLEYQYQVSIDPIQKKIPAPDYYVFYNGREKAPDRQELRLSDAFLVPKEGYEWTAHMLNINSKGNQGLLEGCPPLKGYVALIEYVREYQEVGNSLPEAMDMAIDRCVREGVLKEYLLKKKSEVKLMLLKEFDEEAFAETMRAEGRAEGREEGREEGRAEGEKRLNLLYSKLIEEKRADDLARAVQDKGFRDVLYKKYGI